MNDPEIYHQPSLDLGDREIRLPAWAKIERLSCGVIEQILIEEGTYPITSVCEKTKVSSELDLKGCHFSRVLAKQGNPNGSKSKWPIVLTHDISSASIEVHDLKVSDEKIESVSKDAVRDSWIDALRLRTEIPGKKEGFRNAQVGAIHAVLAHWSTSNLPCSVVLPTGTGKTETMLGLTVAERAKLVLVVVPTQELRSQLSSKFRGLGILKKIGVLNGDAFLPRVATLSKRPQEMKEIDRLHLLTFLGKVQQSVRNPESCHRPSRWNPPPHRMLKGDTSTSGRITSRSDRFPGPSYFNCGGRGRSRTKRS